MHTKQCTECLTYKPLDDFHVRRRDPSGRQARCKPCLIAAVMRTVDRERVNATQIEWVKRHHAEVLVRKRERYWAKKNARLALET